MRISLGKENALEYINNQKQVEKQILELVKKYNVLYKKQLYEFFAVDGRDKFVGKALHSLLKDRFLYLNDVTQMVYQHEKAYEFREKGTLMAFWVLISLMKQKKIENHFLSSREEYPVRIIFVGDAEIYDILYVSEEEIQLVNNLFSRKRIEGCQHVVIVEDKKLIPQLQIPDAIGFCTVSEDDGGVEYYRRDE